MTDVATPDTEVVFTVDAPPEVPPGVYLGTLIGMKQFSYETPEGEVRQLVEWQFAATMADGESIEVQGVSSLATGPKSKAFGWLVALLGPDSVTPNIQIRARQLVGHEAQVTIGPDKKGWPKVMDLTAMPRSRPKAAPASESLNAGDPLPF